MSIKVDNALIQTNSYTAQNKLLSINNVAQFNYDKDDALISVHYANGMTNTLTVDKRDREEKREYTFNNTALYSQETQYDSNSNIVKENIFKENQHILKEYTYDNLKRTLKIFCPMNFYLIGVTLFNVAPSKLKNCCEYLYLMVLHILLLLT